MRESRSEVRKGAVKPRGVRLFWIDKGKGGTLHGVLRDLSAGGFCADFGSCPPPGKVIGVEIAFGYENGAGAFCAMAEVKAQEEGLAGPRLHCRFTVLSRDNRARLLVALASENFKHEAAKLPDRLSPALKKHQAEAGV